MLHLVFGLYWLCVVVCVVWSSVPCLLERIYKYFSEAYGYRFDKEYKCEWSCADVNMSGVGRMSTALRAWQDFDSHKKKLHSSHLKVFRARTLEILLVTM